MIDWELVGVFIGVVAVFVIAFFIGRLLRKNRKPKYDERQIAAQGVAFKAAYITLLVYLMLYASYDGIVGLDWLDTYIGMYIGLVLSAIVFAIICIVKDAYFTSTDSPMLLSVVFLIAGALDIFVGVRGALRGDSEWSLLIAGGMFLVVAIAGMVKRGIDRRHADEES